MLCPEAWPEINNINTINMCLPYPVEVCSMKPGWVFLGPKAGKYYQQVVDLEGIPKSWPMLSYHNKQTKTRKRFCACFGNEEKVFFVSSWLEKFTLNDDEIGGAVNDPELRAIPSPLYTLLH